MNMRGKRKTGRKILAFVLSVCMLFTVQPNLWDGVVAQAAETESSTDSGIMTADDSGQHTNHTGWTALSTDTTEAITLSEGKYYLFGGADNEITMGTITIAGNVTLCLNGQTLKHSGTTGSVIVVESGIFTLCDCENDTGCITGGKGEVDGGALYGGGIYVCKGARLIMLGGTIRGNTAKCGGGISIGASATNADTYFTMSGGVIEGNTADSNGGGIFCGGSGAMTITNGVIKNNTTGSRGAGIFAGTGATVNLLANAESDMVSIFGNEVGSTGNGGGYTDFQKAILKIEGNVNITGNKRGSDENNIALLNGRVILLTEKLTGSFGVTTWNAPYSESNPDVNNPYKTTVQGVGDYEVSSQDLARISSDNPDYSVLMIEGKIVNGADGETGKVLVLGKKDTGNLSGMDLSIKDGSSGEEIKLSPGFAEKTYEYSVTVPNSVKAVGIEATPKNVGADVAMTIQNADKATDTTVLADNIPLAEGKNTIKVNVTEKDASKVYIITVTRKAPEGPAKYKVTLNGNDGTGTDLTSYTYGTGAKLPTDWKKTGYDFAGWYEDEGCEGTAVTEISATATGDKEYYAKWTAKTYAVTYNTNGGTIADENNFKKYTYGMGLTLPIPAKAGYTFDGWYEQSDFSGSKVTGISATDTGAKNYYAKWTLSSYTISYELDGGTVTGNPTTYTVESSTITLKNPTKEGYTFTGWSGTGLTGEQNTTVTIPKGSTENREYIAHWAAAGYKVTLEGKGGTGGTSLSTYTHGTKVELPTDWMKNGYTFAGWLLSVKLDAPVLCRLDAPDLDFEAAHPQIVCTSICRLSDRHKK